jgi:hypothetical protein
MATDSNENRDNAALEQKLTALHAELQATLRQTNKRAGRIGMLMTLLVLIVAGYWSYIYIRTSDVNAESAADMVYLRAVDYVKASPPVLSKALRDRAPELFNYAETQLLQSPEIVAGQIRAAALKQTQIVLDQAEPRINQVIVDAIAHAKASSSAAGFDGKDPAQLDKLIDVITRQMQGDVKAALDQVYSQYDQRAQEAVAYLEKVAAGKDLDPRQQHLRQVIASFLAVAEKRKTMP